MSGDYNGMFILRTIINDYSLYSCVEYGFSCQYVKYINSFCLRMYWYDVVLGMCVPCCMVVLLRVVWYLLFSQWGTYLEDDNK